MEGHPPNEPPSGLPPAAGPTPPPSQPPPVQPPLSAPPAPMTVSDERTWAMLAHLSVLLNLLTGFLGVVAALVIYLVFKDRSRYVAFQALQSFVFQLIWWGGAGVLLGMVWAVTGTLAAFMVGLLCVPFAMLATLLLLVMPLVALAYGVYAGVETNQGKDFRYWLVGDWLAGSGWA